MEFQAFFWRNAALEHEQIVDFQKIDLADIANSNMELDNEVVIFQLNSKSLKIFKKCKKWDVQAAHLNQKKMSKAFTFC